MFGVGCPSVAPPPLIATEVVPAGVVRHQHDDVGFLVRRLGWSDRAEKRSRGYKQRQAVITYVSFHFGLLLLVGFWMC